MQVLSKRRMTSREKMDVVENKIEVEWQNEDANDHHKNQEYDVEKDKGDG